MTYAERQIQIATEYGRKAMQEGRKRVPAWDYSLMAMIEGRKPNQVPKNEARTVDILKAWSEGWDQANIEMA